jgi:hypothetical protein
LGRLVVQARVLDRDPGLRGEDLNDSLVVIGELAAPASRTAGRDRSG